MFAPMLLTIGLLGLPNISDTRDFHPTTASPTADSPPHWILPVILCSRHQRANYASLTDMSETVVEGVLGGPRAIVWPANAGQGRIMQRGGAAMDVRGKNGGRLGPRSVCIYCVCCSS